MVKIIPKKLIVNLILNIRHEDKRRDNPPPTTTLHLTRNLAVPDIVVVSKERANRVLLHGEDQVAIFGLRLAAVHPVCLTGVSEILGVEGDVVQVVPCVGLVLANGSWGTGVEAEGGERVTAAKAFGAFTTLPVF